MATPIRYSANNVGTVALPLTTAGNTTALFAVRFSNKLNVSIQASLYVANSSSNVYLVPSVTIPSNTAIGVIGGDAEKHFIMNGDTLVVVSSVAASLDVYVSGAMGVVA